MRLFVCIAGPGTRFMLDGECSHVTLLLHQCPVSGFEWTILSTLRKCSFGAVLDLDGALVALKVVTWNPSVRSVGSAVIAILFVFL